MPEIPLTVLLSVYNGEAYVAEAVRSILNQTFGDFEFLIIDDASTDGTAEVLRTFHDPRLRIVRQETNAGLTASLSRGLELASGALVARQDADDVSHPQRLLRQVHFLRAYPSVAAVGAQAWLIDGAGRAQGRKDFPLGFRSIWWAHLFDNALAHSAVTFRKAAVLEAGGYDESFRASQDYDLWSRLGERHLLANLPDRLVTLRILETSVTRTYRQADLIRRIQSAHAERLFPGRSLSAQDLDLLALFRSRVPPESLPEFLALFQELLESFHAAWPETRVSGDFARTLALQYERIGYNLLPAARGPAWKLIARAIRIWPPRVLALPWLRLAALSVLGHRARALYQRLFGSGSPAA